MIEKFFVMVFVIIVFLISYTAGLVIAKNKRFAFVFDRKERYGAIDGLRGYLALSVFIHHFIITWYWKNSGIWQAPPEIYFQNFGKVAIAIFFMITGFLFISKIIYDNGKTNWYKLYKSRIYRIYPLYIFVLLLISLVVFYESDFKINVEPEVLLKQYFKWLIYYGYIINDYINTNLIIAGVDWTLKYEWVFYLSLPLVSFFVHKNKFLLIIFILSIFMIYVFPQAIFFISTKLFIFFLIGGLTAYLNLYNLYFLKNKFWASVAILSLSFAIFYPVTLDTIHIMLIAIFFIIIALGNSLFGLLQSKASKILGEISYSIYLMHGFVLYMLFSVINISDLTMFSLFQYIQIMPMVSLLVLLVAMLTYLTIELPSINYNKRSNK